MVGNKSIELVVIFVYFILLIILGYVLRKLSKDTSDYFRNGCKGTWWLVGMSAFMCSFSAWSFTGLAGVAYEAGWTFSIIFIAGAIGFFIQFLVLAPWFRQLRVITLPEVLKLRFGPVTQHFYAYIKVVSTLLGGAMQLYALSIFCSAVFGFPIQAVILVLGAVVLAYSFSGGSWAVMATDFLQGMVLIPMTVLVGILCLMQFGGISSFFSAIESAGLEQTYKIVNMPGEFPGMKYTWIWVCAYFLHNLFANTSLNAAPKYFGVKDGREARKAALFGCFLMLFGIAIWSIPPMTARLLYSEAVNAMNINKPAEASYAIISLKLLPNGLTGLIVVTIFSATMSSMDTALNRNAAIFTQDIYPAICRAFRKKPVEGLKLLGHGRIYTLMFGFLVISLSLYFSVAGDAGVFTIFLNIGATLTVPLVVPLLLCLFIKNVPSWAAIFAVCAALSTSIFGYFSEDLIGVQWLYQHRIFSNVSVGAIAFLLTVLFRGKMSAQYKDKVDSFFKRMHRPVDFENEVGSANDSMQLKVVGSFALAAGFLITSLLTVPNDLNGRLSIFAVGSVVSVIGIVMILGGRYVKSKQEPGEM